MITSSQRYLKCLNEWGNEQQNFMEHNAKDIDRLFDSISECVCSTFYFN